jgi:hypothetical protein
MCTYHLTQSTGCHGTLIVAKVERVLQESDHGPKWWGLVGYKTLFAMMVAIYALHPQSLVSALYVLSSVVRIFSPELVDHFCPD